MARANRYYIPNCVWHITHRYHKREFLLRYLKDRKRWIHWLFEAKPDTPEGDRLDVLTTLVEAYENIHYKMPKPNTIDAIFYYIESREVVSK